MKKAILAGILALVCVLVLCAAFVIRTDAFQKTNAVRFVSQHHEAIEEMLAETGGALPAGVTFSGCQSAATWGGGSPIVEFITMALGDTYYGCYYSPEDVPLAFQNTDAELIQSGHDHWVWYAEDDNHGSTSKIMPCWYYFSASF